MEIKITRLQKIIKPNNKIVLYGAGDIAQRTVKVLEEYGIVPAFCVVSDLKNAKIKINSIPVRSLEECESELKSSNIVIFIAVTELYREEIENILIQKNISNYLFIIDYIRDNISKYKKMEEQDCLAEIAEWYIDAYKMDLEDIPIVSGQLQNIIKNRKYDENKITLIVGNTSPRIIKITKALQKKNYKIEILFYSNPWLNEVIYKNLEELSDLSSYCNTLEELMYYLIYSDAKVVHIFSSINVCDMAYILLAKKEMFPKLVFEQYDITNGMYHSVEKAKFGVERYCLEQADGLCCRGYELEYLVKEIGYKINGKVCSFFDYCNDEEVDETMSEDEAPLSLCYAGGIATENEWPGASYSCLLEYAALCERNHCHLHIYPAVWDNDRFADYIEFDKKSQYFHFHKPILYENLINELSQYDYGIGIFFKRSLAGRNIDGYYTKEKLVYAACNHYYDYLSAGLPIISAVPVKLSKYFKDKGVLLDWALEDYDFQQLKRSRKEFRQKAVSIKRELCISYHIDRLIEFYDSLLA